MSAPRGGAARWWGGALAVAITAMTACQEKLTSPADCPELCPGGTSQVYDTIIPVTPGLDSSFTGYVDRGGGVAVLVSNGLPASEDRAIYRFAARGDSISVRDTLRAYTVDSVAFTLTIVARDTMVKGLNVELYRLPPTVDSTATFAAIDPLLAGTNLITTIGVPDSARTGSIKGVLRGAEADVVALPPGGDSVLAIGVRIAAAAPTGVRLGALASSSAATFTSYVTVDVPDTGSIRHQTLNRATAFNTFVTQTPLQPVDTLLAVGGEPSSRALLRFALSGPFLDSVTIVRASLELFPAAPMLGLPGDSAILEARAVVGDLGAKSPLTNDTRFIVDDTLPTVVNDTVRLEVTPTVQVWQSARERPQAIFLLLRPEAATFTRAIFGSSRSPSVPAPRLRITYQRPFRFENP